MDRYEAIVGAIENLKEALGKAGFHLEVGISAKPPEPEKPERKIDGDEFKDWCIGDKLARLSDTQEKLAAAAPNLMRAAIDEYNWFDEYNHNEEELARHFKLGEAIKQAGFGFDILQSDRYAARMTQREPKAENICEHEEDKDDQAYIRKMAMESIESAINGKIMFIRHEYDGRVWEQKLADEIEKLLPIIIEPEKPETDEIRRPDITESKWFMKWKHGDPGFPGDHLSYTNGIYELSGITEVEMDLLKAAPELLEAAKVHRVALGEYCDGLLCMPRSLAGSVGMMDDAIAKAEGNTKEKAVNEWEDPAFVINILKEIANTKREHETIGICLNSGHAVEGELMNKADDIGICGHDGKQGMILLEQTQINMTGLKAKRVQNFISISQIETITRHFWD